MRFAKVCLIAAAVSSAAMVVPASIVWADATPKPDATKPPADVATLLFGTPQWDKAPAGSSLTYAYSKKTGQAVFGPSFDDHIVLKLDPGDKADSRVTNVKMFSGANSKPAGPFASDPQNPVLLLVMEENVQEMSKLFKANPRYLKNAIRKAWRDDAKIAPGTVEVDGKSVPGTTITVSPFLNDPEKDRMMGLDGMTYTVEIADSVPGNIAKIEIHAPAVGKAIFSETLTYQGESK